MTSWIKIQKYLRTVHTFRNTPRVIVWRIVRSGTFTFGRGLGSILVRVLSYRGGLPAISQGINFNISICIISASYFDRIQVHKQQQKADTFKKSAPHLLLREEEGFIVSAELPGWQRYKIYFNCLRMNKFQTFKKSKTNEWWTYLFFLFRHLV